MRHKTEDSLVKVLKWKKGQSRFNYDVNTTMSYVVWMIGFEFEYGVA